MSSATNSVLESLIGVLLAVHTTADTVYWYQIYDNPKDDPEHPQYFDKDGNSTLLAVDKEEMINLNKMSLRLQTGFDEEQWLLMLAECALLQRGQRSVS